MMFLSVEPVSKGHPKNLYKVLSNFLEAFPLYSAITDHLGELDTPSPGGNPLAQTHQGRVLGIYRSILPDGKVDRILGIYALSVWQHGHLERHPFYASGLTPPFHYRSRLRDQKRPLNRRTFLQRMAQTIVSLSGGQPDSGL